MRKTQFDVTSYDDAGGNTLLTTHKLWYMVYTIHALNKYKNS